MRVSHEDRWRVSSFSGPNGNCVMVRADLAALRDSKDATVLPAGSGAVSRLVAFVRA